VAEASATRVRDHCGVWIPPPLLYAALFLLAMLFEDLVPLPLGSLVPEDLAEVAGPGLIAAGMILSFWSVGALQRRGTSMIPIRPTTSLVTDGPYRFSRNPMYLGLVGIFVGVALVKQLLWGLLLAPLLVLVITVVVTRKEEAYLAQKFGAEYRRYRTAVRRWL
jgi:protein-S-isoprenylcysteine O-methyltransferase Ste14